MAENFIPKKIVENNVEYVLLDDVFRHEETINYAVAHNFNIKFICTTYTCACKILQKIYSKEYELRFKKVTRHSAFADFELTDIVVYCIL